MTTRSGLPFLVSASAWSQRVPPRGSTREKWIIWPPLPRRPVLRSSSRQSDWRSVGPERAMEASAGSAGVSPALDFSEEEAAWKAALRGRSSRDLTLGAGTASPGGSLLAMDFRVTWGTFLYSKPLPTPSLGWASL